MEGWVDLDAEIRTCNLPIASLALYHTATGAQWWNNIHQHLSLPNGSLNGQKSTSINFSMEYNQEKKQS